MVSLWYGYGIDRVCMGYQCPIKQKATPLRVAKSPHRDTPAHAGKTVGTDLPVGYPLGSPPHTRGKLKNAAILKPRLGITPAHTGKTHRP